MLMFTIQIPDEVLMVVLSDDIVVVVVTVQLNQLFKLLRNISETSLITCKVYVTTALGSNPSTVN